MAERISSAVNAKGKKDSKNRKDESNKGGIGNLLGAVGALVVAGAAVYIGSKLRKKGAGRELEEGGEGKDEEGKETEAVDSTATDDAGEHVLSNGDQHSFPLDSEAEEILKNEALQFLLTKDVAQGADVRSDATGKDKHVADDSRSIPNNSMASPANADSDLKHIQISHSPFNTAPSSPSLIPDSPFHDASGELEYDDHHIGSIMNSSSNGEVTSNLVGMSYKGPKEQRDDSGDSNVSAITSENGERRASLSAEVEKSGVHALLERARAAAARVDKMHASISAMNRN